MSDSIPLRMLDASALVPVRERLLALGYQEAECAHRLGLGSLRNAVPRMAVRKAQGAKDRFPREPQEPLDLLIALFLFSEPQPEARSREALGEAAWEALLDSGILRQAGSEVAANVLLFPCAGLLLATDTLDDDGVTNRVMPLFSESYDLAALAVRAPVDAALDLCTGSGIHALLACRHAREVIGVDVSARALAFADFNARLNGIGNASFLSGDLYAPVAGRRFGLITANPPYNPEIA
ncbi:MAG TPA: methyltransferase, partial [Vicinamibacteria bacterium]|nr:methyltransferase [Vicinamibacteria bacterium]